MIEDMALYYTDVITEEDIKKYIRKKREGCRVSWWLCFALACDWYERKHNVRLSVTQIVAYSFNRAERMMGRPMTAEERDSILRKKGL